VSGTARQVLDLLERGTYEAPSGTRVSLADAQAGAVDGTRLYTPEAVAALSEPAPGAPARVSVTAESTQEAVVRLGAEGRVAALNFASARNPGGGFLNGARAQEEDLCRCSGLYPCLRTQPAYYMANRRHDSLLYTDYLIFSPAVPFFRVRSRRAFLEDVVLVDVITAPAPNAGPLLRQDPAAGPAIAATFARRWRNVLAVAAERGVERLVLGAWGCGAFGNDPAVASAAFATVWPTWASSFREVVFAIPEKGRIGRLNHGAFRDAVSG